VLNLLTSDPLREIFAAGSPAFTAAWPFVCLALFWVGCRGAIFKAADDKAGNLEFKSASTPVILACKSSKLMEGRKSAEPLVTFLSLKGLEGEFCVGVAPERSKSIAWL
jgi:hypothetical protein